ncbi:unnamed protein product [Brassica rapa subsp. trilocularis]
MFQKGDFIAYPASSWTLSWSNILLCWMSAAQRSWKSPPSLSKQSSYESKAEHKQQRTVKGYLFNNLDSVSSILTWKLIILRKGHILIMFFFFFIILDLGNSVKRR